MNVLKRIKRGLLYAAGFYDNADADASNLFNAPTLDSFDNLNNIQTRETLTARARKVYYNSAFCKNGVDSIAAATVGGVVSIQTTTDNQQAGNDIERRWREWADSIGLENKLRALVISQVVDGEGFAQFINDKTVAGAGKINVVPFDSARVQSPLTSSEYVDGVKVGSNGAPVSYRIMKAHPSDGITTEFVDVPARYIVHMFKQDFPEQRRGVTQLQSVLDVFPLVDRYTRAVVKSAETAASLALCLKSDGFGNFKDRKEKPLEWRAGSIFVLPEGYDATQIHAEQPTAAYESYISSLLNQLGAGLGVPKILLQNSAEKSNYSSARLDLQQFRARCDIMRRDIVRKVLNPLYAYWLQIQGVKPSQFPARFTFEKYVELDPVKEATAAKTLLDANLTTLAEEYSKRGIDWSDALEQRKRELKELKGFTNADEN